MAMRRYHSREGKILESIGCDGAQFDIIKHARSTLWTCASGLTLYQCVPVKSGTTQSMTRLSYALTYTGAECLGVTPFAVHAPIGIGIMQSHSTSCDAFQSTTQPGAWPANFVV